MPTTHAIVTETVVIAFVIVLNWYPSLRKPAGVLRSSRVDFSTLCMFGAQCRRQAFGMLCHELWFKQPEVAYA